MRVGRRVAQHDDEEERDTESDRLRPQEHRARAQSL
jgi:hypothetical protein